jgi:response regulator RpfG family c-di-GMP phosphodiesterase
LEQLSILLFLGDDDHGEASFIAAMENGNCVHAAGAGEFYGVKTEEVLSESQRVIKPLILEAIASGEELYRDGHYVLYRPSNLQYSGFVLYLKSEKVLDEMDKDLIKLFLDNAKIAFENTALTQELDEAQKEIIFTISEIAEQRSNETGQHVKRVALYSKLLGEAYGLRAKELDLIYSASPMHDIGKIAISDAILKKPGKLTVEEMDVMKMHSGMGYEVLKSSKRTLLQTSAIIAHEHHEKWDGTGYPNSKKGEQIHLYARIVALADVFDALGSKRVYKDKWGLEETLNLIKEQRGKQFDPKLVDLFLENIDKVLEIRDQYRDA